MYLVKDMELSGDAGELGSLLNRQRDAFFADGFPSAEVRVDRLERLLAMVKKYDREICDTAALDFGGRSHELSRLTEVLTSLETIRMALKHLRSWMEPEEREAIYPASEAGASAYVHFQPKGVIGVIGPWNFPFHLIIGPLVGVLAAGNRAMIKPSEVVPNSAKLIAKMFGEFFDETEVAVVLGDLEVAQQFSELPFDHLVFTGSTLVGRKIMQAAAKNLVPVTLELGGKSPVIIGGEVDLPLIAERIVSGKLFNTGQICVAPDYAFVPEALKDDFVAAIKAAISKLYPTVENNPDYTAIVNEHHYRRLESLLAEAAQRGAEIIEVNPGNESFNQAATRKMLPKIVLNVADDTRLMQEEIFGPILPLKTYSSIGDVLRYLHAENRPLALYYFGDDEQEKNLLLNNAIAGGMTINDVITHVIDQDLPIGGIGTSGMGAHRGRDGFKEFSHAKAVYVQTDVNEIVSFFHPPYSDEMKGMMEQQIASS